MIAWWFYQSATQFDPDGWWKLASTSSVGTVVIQLSILIGALFLTNRLWVDRMKEAGSGGAKPHASP